MSFVSAAAWLVGGAALSLLHLVTLARSMGRLGDHAGLSVVTRTIGGYLARYVSLLAGLMFALRVSAVAGIVFALGYWVARWFGVWAWMRTGPRGLSPI